MKPVILYRETNLNPDEDTKEQQSILNAGFHLTKSRMDIQPYDLVIGRYSVLPFYKELEYDITAQEAHLINTYQQHSYVADLRNWVEDLQDLTPKTYYRLEDVPSEGSFILKGKTNSRKHLWKTHMYAQDKQAAIRVYLRLLDDTLISQQEIYIREYLPLKPYKTPGINGVPITYEFRLFVCNNQVLSGGYYWASNLEANEIPPSPDMVPKEFLNEVINRINNKVSFYALDVALTEDNKWIVIELNDGQMSGLSCNDPDELYNNLLRCTEVDSIRAD